MKLILVKKNNMVIVTNHNTGAIRILGEGKYWLGWNEFPTVYDMSGDFSVFSDIDILLSMPDFTCLVHTILVPEGGIAMIFKNGNLAKVLGTGRHILWRGLHNYEIKNVNTSNIYIQDDIPANLLQKKEMAPYVRTHKVEANEKALLYIDGKLEKELESGLYYWWANHIPLTVNKTEIRQTILELSGQEILTKDKAQIRINFALRYQVVDIRKALHENKDFEKQLHNMVQLLLRGYVSQMTLDELMENKTQVHDYIMNQGKEKATPLGIDIIDCGLKDIILPGEVKDIMNKVLIAEKKAQANIIMRREETASTRSLLNTAKLMEENAMLMRLKEMEYIEKIAEKVNTISLAGNGQVLDQLKQLFVK